MYIVCCSVVANLHCHGWNQNWAAATYDLVQVYFQNAGTQYPFLIDFLNNFNLVLACFCCLSNSHFILAMSPLHENFHSSDASEADAIRQASQSHLSSTRFIRAGLHEDAIDSLLESVPRLNSVLGQSGVTLQPHHMNKSLETIRDKYILHDVTTMDILADTAPWEEICCHTIKNESHHHLSRHVDLLITMICNLGLAYHMYGLEQKDKKYFRASLNEALKYYLEVERQFERHQKAMPQSILDNIRHVYLCLISGHKNVPSKEESTSINSSPASTSSPNAILPDTFDLSYTYRY